MAASSFFDPDAITFDDEWHSLSENRFILIGLNKFDKLLTISHCHRDIGNVSFSLLKRRKKRSITCNLSRYVFYFMRVAYLQILRKKTGCFVAAEGVRAGEDVAVEDIRRVGGGVYIADAFKTF